MRAHFASSLTVLAPAVGLAVGIALFGPGCLCGSGFNEPEAGRDGAPGDASGATDSAAFVDSAVPPADSSIPGFDSSVPPGTDAAPLLDSGFAITDAGPACDPTYVAATCGPMEICGNGLDDDCDGAADDFCICTSIGASQPCFDGNGGHAGLGACAFGTQTCQTGLGEFPYWGLCAGDILPTEEICDGIDNNCDGCVDEGGVCGSLDPIAVCPADITANTLDTVMFTGSGSDDGTIVSYSWTIISAPAGSSTSLSSTSGTSSSLFLDAAGDWVIELCVTDDDGQTDCCTFLVHSIPGEIFRVELTWDVDDDLDLHLAHLPTATHWNVGVASAPNDCMWDNCTGSGLSWTATTAANGPPYPTPDNDPHLDIDSGFPVPAMGPENINIDGPDEIGYRIGVHYYGVTGGGTDAIATVRVFCNGVEIYSDVQAMTSTAANAPFGQNDFWVVADVDLAIDPVTSIYSCTVSSIDALHPSSWADTNL